MRDLYSRIDASKSDDIVEVSLSFLEVYNEAIRDLLVGEGTRAPGPGLALREDVKKGVTVAGLSQHFPQNVRAEIPFHSFDGSESEKRDAGRVIYLDPWYLPNLASSHLTDPSTLFPFPMRV